MSDKTMTFRGKDGRTFTVTQEQARAIARRMAERDADNPAAWGEVGMLLLDFAALDLDEDDER